MAKYYSSESQAIAALSAIQLNEMGYLQKNKGQDLDKKTPGGSGNYTKYWRDIQPSYQGSAYCQGAQHWCLWKACGEDRTQAKKVACVPAGQNFSYYTPTQAGYFKAAKRWGTEPKVGAWIYFKNSTRIYHVEYVYKVTSSTVYTYGFNTSGSFNQVEANGDGCFPKSYDKNLARIAGYGYPKYDLMTIKGKVPVQQDTIPITMSTDGLKIVVNSTLNVRNAPKTGDPIKTLNNGTKVFATAKTYIDGECWFKIPDGWISAKYCQGWIGENKNKWWYLQPGYKWPQDTAAVIDGIEYLFDKDGYLVTSTFVNEGKNKRYVKADGSLAKKEWIQIDNKWIYAKEDGFLAQSEFVIIYNETYGNELYYFGKDYYMETNNKYIKANDRGAYHI